MNIEVKEFKSLRKLLDRKDKQAIAEQAECSYSLVSAVLVGNRKNDLVEALFLRLVKANLQKLNLLFEKVEQKNSSSKILENDKHC